MHGKFGQFDDIFWRVRLDAVVPYNQQLNRKTVPQQPVSASDHVCLILSDQKSFLNNLTSVASYWTGTSPPQQYLIEEYLQNKPFSCF